MALFRGSMALQIAGAHALVAMASFRPDLALQAAHGGGMVQAAGGEGSGGFRWGSGAEREGSRAQRVDSGSVLGLAVVLVLVPAIVKSWCCCWGVILGR